MGTLQDIIEYQQVEFRQIMLRVGESPQSYLKALVEQVYPALYKISKETHDKYQDKLDTPVSVDSILHELYIRLATCQSIDKICLDYRTFCNHLRMIVRSVLVDKERHNKASKRTPKKYNDSPETNDIKQSVEYIGSLMDKIQKEDPAAIEALSLRYYLGKSNIEIAAIMGVSLASSERLIKRGKDKLKELL